MPPIEGLGWNDYRRAFFDEDQKSIARLLGLLTSEENSLEPAFDLIVPHVAMVQRNLRQGNIGQAFETVRELGVEMPEWREMAASVNRRLDFARDFDQAMLEGVMVRLRMQRGLPVGKVEERGSFLEEEGERGPKESGMSYFWRKSDEVRKQGLGFDDPLRPGFGQQG